MGAGAFAVERGDAAREVPEISAVAEQGGGADGEAARKVCGADLHAAGLLFPRRTAGGTPADSRFPHGDGRRVSRPSPHLLDTIYAVQLRQEWMRGFLIEQGEPALAFIGSRTLADAPEAVAADMRRALGLEAHWSRSLDSWEEALRTLVHELAHLWLGQGGISDFKELLPSENAVEIFCNKVAAEFLVPAGEMRTAWQEARTEEKPFERLARGGGGGNFYLTLGSRLGKRFPAAVYSAAKEGRLQYREAYQLTGLSGTSYDRFGRELGFAV